MMKTSFIKNLLLNSVFWFQPSVCDLPVLDIYPSRITGFLGESMNFTVEYNNTDGNYKNFFWEPSVPYITLSGEPEGQPPYPITIGSNISIESCVIGVFSLKFFLQTTEEGSEKTYLNTDDLTEVVVGDNNKDLNMAANLFMIIGIAFILLFMAMGMDFEKVKTVLKRPVGPGIGFVCQFVFMPLMAFLLGYLLLLTNYEKLGLILLGCCPGGTTSNIYTAMLEGDVNLSVTMSFISTVCAFAMTTFWVWMLCSPLVQDSAIQIPYFQLLFSLIILVIPVGLGMGFKRWKPILAEKVKNRIGRPLCLLIVILILLVSVYTSRNIAYLFSWRHIVSGAALGFSGYICGGLAAYLARMPREQIIAVAIETATQNGGVPFTIIGLSFPSPYSDMATLPILAYYTVSGGNFILLTLAIWKCFAFLRGKFKEGSEVGSSKTDGGHASVSLELN